MASSKQYTVLHPVRHDGIFHARGAAIKLSESDGQRLLDRGVVTPGAPVVEAGPSPAEVLAFAAKLSVMEKAQLIEYAQLNYDLQLASDDKKEALIAAIHDRYVATFVPAVG